MIKTVADETPISDHNTFNLYSISIISPVRFLPLVVVRRLLIVGNGLKTKIQKLTVEFIT